MWRASESSVDPRRVDILLDEPDKVAAQSDWSVVRDRAQNVPDRGPNKGGGATFLTAADSLIGTGPAPDIFV